MSSTTTAPSALNDANGPKDEEGAGEDDADEPPPQPKIEKFDEPDSKLTYRAKLYEKTKSKDENKFDIKPIGIGQVYVKEIVGENKHQMIFRQEPDYKRVLLNEIVTPNLPTSLLPKAISFVFPSPEGTGKFYIIKVRDDKERDELHSTLKFGAV